MRGAFFFIVLGTGLVFACGQVAPPGSPDGDGGQNGSGGATTGGTTASGGVGPSGGSTSGGSTSDGPSGGDSALGGQGTGGVATICPGIVPECEPGLAGCSERGETYTCSECGEMELQGEACVRLLTSDREMGVVCTVRGEKALKCTGGDDTWEMTLDYPMELDVFPTAIRLPDDTSSPGQPLPVCWIDEQGGIGCVEHEGLAFAQSFLGGTDCTDFVLSDAQMVCHLCAGSLACDGGTGPTEESAEDVRQVVASDGATFWLTNAGGIYWEFSEDPILPGSYSFVFADENMTPCGIRDDGSLVCSAYGNDGTSYELPGDFVTGSGVSTRTCVIDVDGTLTCVSLQDGVFEPIFTPPGGDFVEVAHTQAKSCARTRTGTVVCWTDEGIMDEFSARLN